MTWSETLPQLVAVCGDALDPEHRGAAHRLLAREMLTRLATTDRNRDLRHEGYPLHPARQALEGLGGRGGLGPATFYRRQQPGLWLGSLPQIPAPASFYTDELVDIEAQAVPLIAAASADMGSEYFAASRDRLVAYLLVGPWDAATPGQPFPLRFRDLPPAGYSLAGSALTVPAPGNYHVRFDGQLWSASTSAGTDVSLQLRDGGSIETTDTIERQGNDPTDPDQAVTFAIAHNVTLAGALSLRNGSPTHTQVAVGVLRVFER